MTTSLWPATRHGAWRMVAWRWISPMINRSSAPVLCSLQLALLACPAQQHVEALFTFRKDACIPRHVRWWNLSRGFVQEPLSGTSHGRFLRGLATQGVLSMDHISGVEHEISHRHEGIFFLAQGQTQNRQRRQSSIEIVPKFPLHEQSIAPGFRRKGQELLQPIKLPSIITENKTAGSASEVTCVPMQNSWNWKPQRE
jgi:hypothetical protein